MQKTKGMLLVKKQPQLFIAEASMLIVPNFLKFVTLDLPAEFLRQFV